MGKIVSVINYKGGVGKTTTIANLAAGCARDGKRVLLVDADAQSNLTFSLVSIARWRRDFESAKTLRSFYTEIVDTHKVPSLTKFIITDLRVNRQLRKLRATGHIHLVSSHLGLINIDLDLAVNLGGANKRAMALSIVQTYNYFREAINAVKNEYDVVLIDCPPNFNIVTKNALLASDLYIIPTKPDYLSTLGVEELQKHIGHLQQDTNEDIDEYTFNFDHVDLKLLGVLFTMVKVYADRPVSKHQEYISDLRRSGVALLKAKIRHNASYNADIPESLIPLIITEGSAPKLRELIDEYDKLSIEFQGMI
jgi:chromosome partitioning protein